MLELPEEEIIRLYLREKMTIKDISIKFGVCWNTIKVRLINNNVKLRSRGECAFENIRKWREKNPYYQIGKNNPAYKDGLSRSTINRLTKKILVENGINIYKCNRCFDESFMPLNRHHKDRNRSNNSIENLEVLCPKCHAKEHINEREVDYLGRFIC